MSELAESHGIGARRRHRRNRSAGVLGRFAGVLLLSWLCGLPAAAQQAAGTDAVDDAAGDELEITADTMDMNFAAKCAKFNGHVEVHDPRMTLTADSMIVTLSETDELRLIEATGHVVIRQVGTDRRAESGRAVYDVEKGTIVLTEAPAVFDGDNSLTQAEQVTYFRETEVFRFEKGRPNLKFRAPKQAGEPVLPEFGAQQDAGKADPDGE